jgi:orotate phosphoribosyltransferase
MRACECSEEPKGAFVVAKEQSLDNLWLAQTLYEIGAVQFGEFDVSESAAKSPIFINPKKLVSHPMALRVAAKLIDQEVQLALSLRRPRAHPFEVVAGIPVGGILLGLAYSLETSVPLIYPRMQPQGTGMPGIEGTYAPNTRALLIDDLITTGSSIVDTAHFMEQHSIIVQDAVVLIDREQGAYHQLKHHGYNLISILKLDVMLNHYHAQHYIDDHLFERCVTYLREHQAPEKPPMDVADLPPISSFEPEDDADTEE